MHQTFRGSSSTPRQNKGHPAITLSNNNRITLCSYYVQLSSTQCQQLRTLVHNVNKVKGSLDVTITASITSQFRDLYSIYCSYINILTGNINFQGKVYMDICMIILCIVVLFDKYLRTIELSCPEDGHFL